MTRFVVVGGGIVGLATARELLRSRPDAGVTVVEKERSWGAHQTGHNSGVIHAGVYYRPGSLKAKLCEAGRTSMVEFCEEHGIDYQICGKLIVAVHEDELGRLGDLEERAIANHVPAKRISPEEAREYEPEVACVGALRVESTGIVDFQQVCEKLASLVAESGGTLALGSKVERIDGRAVHTTDGEHPYDVLINCAGLHSDRIARLAGLTPKARIVPFRGEYYEVRPERAGLVRGLIYPVPDPSLPFLGVHLTRGIDGSVHAGPNAVLALAREGYRWRTVRPGELAGTLAYPGMWRLGKRYLRYGIAETRRSLSRKRFARDLAELVPALTADDVVRAGAGVRAQAVLRDGSLADDFLIQTAPGQVHVLNAPSPAATSALEIARHIVATRVRDTR